MNNQLAAYYEVINQIKMNMEYRKKQIKMCKQAIKEMQEAIKRFQDKIKEIKNAKNNQ